VLLRHPSVRLSNNSHAGAADYAQWLRVGAAGIDVIHNGISSRVVQETEARATLASLGIPADARVILGVGRLSEEKRPTLWLEVVSRVAARHGDVHVVYIGDGPMRDVMRPSPAWAGRFHLLRTAQSPDVFMRAADVLLVTSRIEGFPNVVVEAENQGTIVVAPDVGGLREAAGETALVTSSGDAESLAAAVETALARPLDDRDSHAASNRKRFTVERMVAETMKVYLSLGFVPSVDSASTTRRN
jgi:glycosyltransferase involved in cell wall biosynthesis